MYISTQRKSAYHKFAYSRFYFAISLTHLDLPLLFVNLYAIDILKHFVIELVGFIFEENANLLAGQVHLVLLSDLMFLDFVQKFYHIINSIVQNYVQLVSIFHMNAFFH